MSSIPDLDQLKGVVRADTPLEELRQASEVAEALRARGDELLDQFVDAARTAGSSWSEIGCALGTSKQAAQQRFGVLSEPSRGEAPFGLIGPAATVLTEAAAQARELGHHYVRPEHLVLGLLAQPQEIAGQVLAELGVTPETARERLRERLGEGLARPAGSLGMAPQTKRVLELARAISRSLGHRCPRTEHILLATVSPKLHGPGAQLLADCGVCTEQVRDQLIRTLIREAPELADRLRRPSLRSRIRMRGL